MKLSSRGRRVLETVQQNENPFLEQLQSSLVEFAFPTDIGIDQFQKLYQKKKILSQTIDDYRQKNKYYMDDIQKAKQRIYQISQLNDKANRQSVMMRNQINKINDAHMVSKILMMEKIVKLGLEQQNMQKKRIRCSQIKQQKQRLSKVNQSLSEQKQRNRQISLQQSKNIKFLIKDTQFQTIQENRSRADRIRSEKQRRKQRLLRYEVDFSLCKKFKVQQAKKNYLQKTQNLRKNLQEKSKLLQTLCLQQQKQQKHYQTTQLVTKQYLQNMFHAAQNSTVQNSSIFPTQSI